MNSIILRQCLLGSLMICGFSNTTVANSEIDTEDKLPVKQVKTIAVDKLPSLSARHIRWHEPSERELIRVDLSADGFRVRQAVQGDRHREMLQDFKTNDAWLTDQKRSMAHRLPLEDDTSTEMLRPGDGASFLSSTPCGAGQTAELDGQGRWRGRLVDTWYCKNADGETDAIEFVDKIYGIVVYKRSAIGLVDELKNFQEREFGQNYFRPDSTLRTVDRQEFFGGVPNLKLYNEDE